MKSLVIVLSALVSSSVFASPITCSGNGYAFKGTIAPAGVAATATLKVPGEAAPRKMTCAIPAIEPGRKGGDQTYPIMMCSDSSSTGYSVNVSGGGQIGSPTATVRANGKFAQPKYVISMVCSR